MNVEDFRLLYDYNAWADHRTLDACAGLNEEQFTRDLGSSYRSVRDTLVHIMLVEWLWAGAAMARDASADVVLHMPRVLPNFQALGPCASAGRRLNAICLITWRRSVPRKCSA